ncbi:hypothetical protein VZT92_006996 [Zoarces viviparus]|uniref:Uncharacterized protein n=1 Tax=Zoarces viviparus TaxID=48416 RepID=A0AAW1FI13_ZOAVI
MAGTSTPHVSASRGAKDESADQSLDIAPTCGGYRRQKGLAESEEACGVQGFSSFLLPQYRDLLLPAPLVIPGGRLDGLHRRPGGGWCPPIV